MLDIFRIPDFFMGILFGFLDPGFWDFEGLGSVQKFHANLFVNEPP
jgi:hypothetical protein